MGDVKIRADQFFQRLERLQTHLQEHKSSIWGGVDALTVSMGTSDDSVVYSKSAALHLYLFGYEFPDSVIVITRGHFFFMATSKKNAILQKDLLPLQAANPVTQLHFLEKSKDEGQNKEHFHDLLNAMRKSATAKKVGRLTKENAQGSFVAAWLAQLQQSEFEAVDAAGAFGSFFAVKDEAEVELCKRAAILTNKVMKHGFVSDMEDILDSGKKVRLSLFTFFLSFFL